MQTNKEIFKYLREYFNKALSKEFEAYVKENSENSLEKDRARFRTVLTRGALENSVLTSSTASVKSIYSILLGFNKSYDNFKFLQDVKSLPLLYDSKLAELVEDTKDPVLRRFSTKGTLATEYVEKPIPSVKIKRKYFNKNNINYLKFDPAKQAFYGLTYDSVLKSLFETFKESLDRLFKSDKLNLDTETKVEEFLKEAVESEVSKYRIRFGMVTGTSKSLAYYMHIYETLETKSPSETSSGTIASAEAQGSGILDMLTQSYSGVNRPYSWNIVNPRRRDQEEIYRNTRDNIPRKVLTQPGEFLLQEFPVTKVITNTFDIVKGHQAEMFKNNVDTYIKSIQKTFNNFSVLTGDFISHYYHVNRYTEISKDNLHNSCMRNNPNPIFYSAFPENIGMLSLFDRIGKLKGRGILWEGHLIPGIGSSSMPEIGEHIKEKNKIKVVDRVYYDSPETYNLFTAYCNNKGIKTCYPQSGIKRLDKIFVTILPDLSLEQIKVLVGKYKLFERAKEGAGRRSPVEVNDAVTILDNTVMEESEDGAFLLSSGRENKKSTDGIRENIRALFRSISWPYMDSLGHIRKVRINGEVKLALTNESGRTFSNFTADFIEYYASKFPEYANAGNTETVKYQHIGDYKDIFKNYIKNTQTFPILFEGKRVVFDTTLIPKDRFSDDSSRKTFKTLEILKNTIGEVATTLNLTPTKQLIGPQDMRSSLKVVSGANIPTFRDSKQNSPYHSIDRIMFKHIPKSNFDIFTLTSALFKNLLHRDINNWEYLLISSILIQRIEGASSYTENPEFVAEWIKGMDIGYYLISELSLKDIEEYSEVEIDRGTVNYSYANRKTIAPSFEAKYPKYKGMFNSLINEEVIAARTSNNIIPGLANKSILAHAVSFDGEFSNCNSLTTPYLDRMFSSGEDIDFSFVKFNNVVNPGLLVETFKKVLFAQDPLTKVKLKLSTDNSRETEKVVGTIYYNILGQDIPIKKTLQSIDTLYKYTDGTYGILKSLRTVAGNIEKICNIFEMTTEAILDRHYPHLKVSTMQVVTGYRSSMIASLRERVSSGTISWDQLGQVVSYYIYRMYPIDVSADVRIAALSLFNDNILKEIFENEITLVPQHESNSIFIEFLDCLSKHIKEETTKSEKSNE